MIDFDEKEINVLEELFPDIEVFVCSFYREQVWTGWTNESKHSVSHIADDIKCRLCRITYGYSRVELDKLNEDSLSWNHFAEKLMV